ncbi:hypothetical protein APSETT445_004013 [Aspergillus pseudonomiae]
MPLRSISGDINPHKFRVVIVGGSIAGLTLAHALAAYSIDFVVLEAREEIAPNVGASIGFTGNSPRILEQLDVHGYPVIFLMRQQVLDVLWNKLPDKSRVLAGKKVVKMQQTSTEATVHCLDGSTYTGDIVVGADGVHSIIHREMYRHMEMMQLGMVTQYRGVFGISNSVAGIREGEMHNVFVKGASILTIGCKDHVFWIVGVKMERTYYAPEAVRFDQSQLENDLAFLMSKYVCAGVQFKETIGIGSAVAWVILELKDVSAEKKLRLPWVYIFLALPLCLILVGPAATFALGWGLREEILARDYREKASTDSVASKEHDLFANMQQGRDSWLRVVRNTDFFYDLETFSLDDHNEWVHRAT